MAEAFTSLAQEPFRFHLLSLSVLARLDMTAPGTSPISSPLFHSV